MTDYPDSAADDGEHADGEWRVEDGSPGDAMSVGTAMELLADGTRRALLYALSASSDRSASTDALVSDVLFRREDRRADDPDDRRTVRVAVRHVHLPKLRDADVLEYDAGTGRVTYCPPDTLEKLLAYVSMIEEGPTR
jgi:hypothetical protein